MSDKVCCALAKRLGPVRLDQMNAELRAPSHRSFGKMAAEFGETDKKPIERHKHRCLKVGNPERKATLPGPDGLPPVRVSPGTNGTTGGTETDVPVASDTTRLRAPVSANLATSRDERVVYVLGQMAAGTFDDDRDILSLANTWDMAPSSVGTIIAEAKRFRRINRGDVTMISEMSMSYWRRISNESLDAEPEGMDTKSKLLAVAAQAQAGWDKAAGLHDGASKVQINFGTDPRFVAAAKRYVDAVQTALAAHEEIAARIAPQLGAVPAETIAAILAAADALIAERVAPEPPRLPG